MSLQSLVNSFALTVLALTYLTARMIVISLSFMTINKVLSSGSLGGLRNKIQPLQGYLLYLCNKFTADTINADTHEFFPTYTIITINVETTINTRTSSARHIISRGQQNSISSSIKTKVDVQLQQLDNISCFIKLN